MTPEEVKKKVLKDFTWEPWVERPMRAFIASNFKGGNSKKAFKKIGLSGWEYVYIFNNGRWYKAKEIYNYTKPKVEEWIKNHKLSEISDGLEKFYIKNKIRILELREETKRDVLDKMIEINKILSQITTYIWVAHILEEVLLPKLEKGVAKYIKGDVQKFIGDASYPEKKNMLELMEEEMRNGADPKILAKKYGWMRVRDGFARPYTSVEMVDYAKGLNKATHVYKYPDIPKQLKGLFSETRELVYFRTRRTDILHEFLFLARPIFREIAKRYSIPFAELKYYTIQSLIGGKPRKYPKDFSCIGYREEEVFFDKPIFLFDEVKAVKEIKGAIAQMGIVRGKARVIMNVSELNKMKKGEILVTYMTSPNFLPAMKLASGFVTDEGGLTCHAAIVAREMKKPCVIATKIATKVIKDGDLVEVDANKGIVRIIK